MTVQEVMERGQLSDETSSDLRQGRKAIVFPHKAGIARILLVGVCITMTGSDGWSSTFQEGAILFYRPAINRVPRAVSSWYSSCLRLDMVSSVFTKCQNGRTYIFVSSGVKPIRGYAVRVSSIYRTSERALAVHATFLAPPKGRIARQHLMRPNDLVTIRDTGWTVTVVSEGSAAPYRVAGLVGVRELRPITSESRAIKIFSPSPGGVAGRVLHVSGVALVFEGTVQMRLRVGGGQVIAQAFATAASAVDWGYFAKDLVVPDTVSPGNPLRLDLFTIDEEKGGEINIVKISLKLHRRN